MPSLTVHTAQYLFSAYICDLTVLVVSLFCCKPRRIERLTYSRSPLNIFKNQRKLEDKFEIFVEKSQNYLLFLGCLGHLATQQIFCLVFSVCWVVGGHLQSLDQELVLLAEKLVKRKNILNYFQTFFIMKLEFGKDSILNNFLKVW